MTSTVSESAKLPSFRICRDSSNRIWRGKNLSWPKWSKIRSLNFNGMLTIRMKSLQVLIIKWYSVGYGKQIFEFYLDGFIGYIPLNNEIIILISDEAYKAIWIQSCNIWILLLVVIIISLFNYYNLRNWWKYLNIIFSE